MTRAQYIRFCLLISLRKRVWLVILPALACTSVLFLLSFSAHLSVALGILMLLGCAAGIAWSSYQRHKNEFNDFPSGLKVST